MLVQSKYGMQKSSSPSSTAALSESLEDYLEAILRIEEEKEVVRPKDIAAYLQVSPPSVTAAMQNLDSRGLATYRPYERVLLTPSGRRIAEDVIKRHEALLRFFTDILCVESEEADRVACSMEHSLPPHILARLVALTDLIITSPHGRPVLTADDVLTIASVGTPPAQGTDS